MKWFDKVGWPKEWIDEARDGIRKLWNDHYKPDDLTNAIAPVRNHPPFLPVT